ncbi:MAG: hypothetical protein JRI95_08815 [Deltaproteobacteria bacterium]|nr:hypothetical protein [Deltaproteobacteria bacterium]
MTSSAWLFDDLNDIEGMRVTRSLLESLFKETTRLFKRYYNNFDNDKREYGFYYSERQLHTFLTPAIDKLTKGFFLFESPIKRGKRGKRGKSGGRVDYWLNYRNSSYLLEVKHAWIRVHFRHGNEEFTLYKLEKTFQQAIDQLDNSEDKVLEFMYRGNMFGVALAIVPVFGRGDVLMKVRDTDQLLSRVRKECPKANAIYAWHLPRAYSKILDIQMSSGAVVREFYPMVLFIAKVKKLSRTRNG